LHYRSAFFWFCNDERSKVKALNPEFGVGDIAKELGRRWSDVDPELKSKYEAMAEKDKARYDRVSAQLIMLTHRNTQPAVRQAEPSMLCC
jgi:IS30 family transposase